MDLLSLLTQVQQRVNDAIREITAGMGSAEPLEAPVGNLGIAAGTRIMPPSMSPGTGSKPLVLEIRIGASLKATGISVDDRGAITAAPGGLFDQDYTIVRMDGNRFTPNMQHLVRQRSRPFPTPPAPPILDAIPRKLKRATCHSFVLGRDAHNRAAL